MKRKRITKFVLESKFELSPLNMNLDLEKWKEEKKDGHSIYSFYDNNGIQHYFFRSEDYRKKILTIQIMKNPRTKQYPTKRTRNKITTIVTNYARKSNILKIEKISNIIKIEILFPADKTVEYYQRWMNNLARTLTDRVNIYFSQLKLSIAYTNKNSSIIPDIDSKQY